MRRPRRSLRVVLLVVMALVPGAASAQTTTSTTPTSTTTSSVAPTTTSTALADPCTGQPCTEEPPQVVLASTSGQIHADRGGYCWRRPADPNRFCVALARPLGYQPPILVVTEGETVTVRFTPPVPGTPVDVSLATDGVVTPLTAANPTTFRVTLAPGVHDNLAILARWPQGEAPYGFRLDVRRVATPAEPSGGRLIALTG